MSGAYSTPTSKSKVDEKPCGILDTNPALEALFREWKVKDTEIEIINLSSFYDGYGGRYCAIIDGLLTVEECRALIEMCEVKEWEAALLVDTKVEDIRKSKRIMIDDNALADLMYQRIMLALGSPQEQAPAVMYKKRMTRMNNRFRFLKYTEGDYFKMHMDGSYQTPNDKECSMVTVQVYLNNGGGVDCTGGETNIYGPDARFYEEQKDEKNEIIYSVVPKTGRCLLFDHRTSHEGAFVSDGVKYAVRNDLMYDLTSHVEASSSEKKESTCAVS